MKITKSLSLSLQITIIIFLLVFTPTLGYSQNFGGCATESFEENNFSKHQGCGYESDSWLNDYRTPEYWIPDINTPLKTVRVNWVVCRDDNGQNGWQDTPQFRDQVDLMFSHINEWYSNSQPKGYSLTCEPSYTHLHDTRIRFELNEIIFIDSTIFNQMCWAGVPVLDYIHQHYPGRKSGDRQNPYCYRLRPESLPARVQSLFYHSTRVAYPIT